MKKNAPFHQLSNKISGYNFLIIKPTKVKVSWGDQGVDGRIILRWIFGKWEGWRLDGFGSGYGQMVGTCEYGDELSGSIKYGEFLD